MLAISGQHVAVLAAVIYFALRAFAVPGAPRTITTLALIWLYILVAGAPPSAIRVWWNWCRMPAGTSTAVNDPKTVAVMTPVASRHLREWLGRDPAYEPAEVGGRDALAQALR